MNEDSLIEAFLTEGRDLCRQAAAALEVLVESPQDGDALEACFRAIHTLKGSTGLFDMGALERLLHGAEGRLEAARRQGAADQSLLIEALRAVDMAEAWLDALEGGDGPDEDLIRRTEAVGRMLVSQTTDQPPADAQRQAVEVLYRPRSDAYFMGEDPLALLASIPGLTNLRLCVEDAAAGPLYDPFRCVLVLRATYDAPRQTVATALRLVSDQVEISATRLAAPEGAELATDRAQPSPGPVATSLRVPIARLDELMRMTNDWAQAADGLSRLAKIASDLPGGDALAHDIADHSRRLQRLGSDARAALGQARLTALSTLFERLPRLVRGLEESLGKRVRLTVSGGELEVDRAIVDGLHEPLLHVVRNSLDHGLESAAVRQARGKDPQGHLEVRAERRGDLVVISVSDDGGGLDVEAVARRALERGLIDAKQAADMNTAEAAQLIFLPGFSTASEVTAVSGRGVGMDAVRTAAAQLGGRVEMTSRPGLGAATLFSMPISIALSRLLVVACGGTRVAIAADLVDRVERRSGGEGSATVRTIDLAGHLGLPSQGASCYAVLLRGQPRALLVDAVEGRMAAVTRPLEGLMAGAPHLSGWTVGRGGEPLLVLDLEALS